MADLVEAILRELGDMTLSKATVVQSATWLLRLGEGERARERFLATRALLVRKRARQIKFEGDVSLYVSELAMVCFTLVKNTCEWYMAAFKENAMASGFVRWASQQIEAYAEMFRRQVYGPDQDPRVIEESLAVTRTHALMLKDVGLDFSFQCAETSAIDLTRAASRRCSSPVLPSSLVAEHRLGICRRAPICTFSSSCTIVLLAGLGTLHTACCLVYKQARETSPRDRKRDSPERLTGPSVHTSNEVLARMMSASLDPRYLQEAQRWRHSGLLTSRIGTAHAFAEPSVDALPMTIVGSTRTNPT